MEELARTLREEETLSYLQESTTATSVVTRAIPSAPPGPPPPDIVTDLSSEETEPGPGETAPDTRQLVRNYYNSKPVKWPDEGLILFSSWSDLVSWFNMHF